MDLRVRQVCKEKGMTMKGLADKLGMKPESLSRIINGSPTITSLQKVADALNVPLIALFSANCPNCGARFAKVAEATEPQR